jgi:hypothetical protein
MRRLREKLKVADIVFPLVGKVAIANDAEACRPETANRKARILAQWNIDKRKGRTLSNAELSSPRKRDPASARLRAE